MTTKTCTKCGIDKNINEFYKDKSGKNGLSASCKSCRNIQSKEWAKNNPERRKNIANMSAKKHYNKEKTANWRSDNPEAAKIINDRHQTKYRINNNEKIAVRNKNYRLANPEKYLLKIKEWQAKNPEKHDLIKIRHKAKRERELGFIPLNEKFVGSVGHHIDKNFVVYISEKLHKSIPHSQGDKDSMYKINIKARGVLL